MHALSSYTRLGQQACAEQFDARSSIHLALERFKTVNVSLDRSVAPRFRYCCFDGAQGDTEKIEKAVAKEFIAKREERKAKAKTTGRGAA